MLTAVHSTLQSIPEVQSALASGESLFLAGSRQALAQLPPGNWVGGSIPYFMAEQGGLFSEDQIFVTRVPAVAVRAIAADYGPGDLAALYREAPENGFTFLVLPSGSEVAKTFAEQAPSFDGFLLRPVVGWVAGVRVERIGQERPAVFNGSTGKVLEDRAVALHVALPAGWISDLEIVNIFESGGGDTIRFEQPGFHATNCLVNGEWTNLADYLAEKGCSTEFPLVGDYSGSSINVSFQAVNREARSVDFYAPVFPGVDYHLARPVADYSRAFSQAIAQDGREPAFACNCILNYLYGKLEGRKAGGVTGPVTFGEIAHQLLNQTMVRLCLLHVGG